MYCDGSGLVLASTTLLASFPAPAHTYRFTSSHTGYSNRSGTLTAQEITGQNTRRILYRSKVSKKRQTTRAARCTYDSLFFSYAIIRAISSCSGGIFCTMISQRISMSTPKYP